MSEIIENENLDQKQDGEDTCKQKNVLGIVKKVSSIIGFVFLGIVMLLVAWLCFDKYVLGSPVPRLFGKSGLIVLTGSMSGTIEEGDVVIIEKTDDYKIGDIITYLPEGFTTPTTHRIVGYTEDGAYITCGDANKSNDTEPVQKEQILGEVVNVVPKVGLFFTWLKSEFGWIYLVGGIVIVSAGIFIYRFLVSQQESEQDGTPNEQENKEVKDE